MGTYWWGDEERHYRQPERPRSTLAIAVRLRALHEPPERFTTYQPTEADRRVKPPNRVSNKK